MNEKEEEILVSFLRDYEELRRRVENEKYKKMYSPNFSPVYRKGYKRGWALGAGIGLLLSASLVRYLPFPNILTIPLFILSGTGMGLSVGGLISLYLDEDC